MEGVKGENKMRINKEYNIEEIVKELEHGIEVTKQKNVSISILTAQAVVDIFNAIYNDDYRVEKGNILDVKKESAAKCYGNFDEDDMLCTMCELERDCKEAAKNGELEKPHCFGEYEKQCELMYKKAPCEFIDDCRTTKANRTGVEIE